MAKRVGMKGQYEHILTNAILITETAMELKERCASGEKYARYLRSLASRVAKTILTLHSNSRSFLILAQKLLSTGLKNMETARSSDNLTLLRIDFEKLLCIVDREIHDFEVPLVPEQESQEVNTHSATEKIRQLESRQSTGECLTLRPSGSARSFIFDERYPDDFETQLDLTNVVNLPTVPEDALGLYPRPQRTSSASSVKNIRRMKLHLQRAASSETDEDDLDQPGSSRSP